ncbi:MAG: hypothetical protein ACOC1F_01305 [Myxococcota bacterium]
MSHRSALLRLAGLLLVVMVTIAVGGCGGCIQRGGQTSFGIMPGVVNDPGNRSLRRAIMRFGLEEFCRELTHRGAPLRTQDDDPVVGRFYARTCNYQELQSGDVFVQFSGVGYAWTNVTWRIAFKASGAIQYNQDFLMDGSTMYAYFRTRTIASQSFETTMVERGGAAGAAVLGGLTNPVAQQVVQEQLRRGFTVIRESDGTVEFGVGLIEKGQHPVKPFEVHGDDRLTLMNERTDVHGNQLDFLGPFHVTDDDRALFLTLVIDGVPAADVMVVDKSTGDQWLDRFVKQPGVPQPPMPPLFSDSVAIRSQWQKTVPVAKGHYYVVLDNSSVVGSVAPPSTGGVPMLAAPPPAALVNVVVQVGDAP